MSTFTNIDLRCGHTVTVELPGPSDPEADHYLRLGASYCPRCGDLAEPALSLSLPVQEVRGDWQFDGESWKPRGRTHAERMAVVRVNLGQPTGLLARRLGRSENHPGCYWWQSTLPGVTVCVDPTGHLVSSVDSAASEVWIAAPMVSGRKEMSA